jgi:cytoplasmic iron level regulating protein YaaA (DUF328/UPF0246 family)
MLAVISPAKTLDFQTPVPVAEQTDILFPEAAATLVEKLRTYSPEELQGLMALSPKLAQLNAERFSEWQLPFADDQARAAIFAFKGDVYTGLDAYSLEPLQLEYLNQHLFILSGLYGLLRPTDGILPYRLEMGRKVPTEKGNTLYDFWHEKLAQTVLSSFPNPEDQVLINLASQEYFQSIAPHLQGTRVITPVFQDEKNGVYKIISFFAKKARGLMVRYMAEQQLTDPEQLKSFDVQGYRFNEELSTADEWVFRRPETAQS